MSDPVIISPGISFAENIFSELKQKLDDLGYVLLRLSNDFDDKVIQDSLLVLATIIGQKIAKDISYHVLEGNGSDIRLSAHVEGIYATAGITSHFALGCIVPSQVGGETRLFDSRKAAKFLKEKYPTMVGTLIRYRSRAYPHEKAEYSLVENDPKFGDVLRHRSGEGGEIISASGDFTLETIDTAVNEVLKSSLILTHSWAKGDMLIVNNGITLHDREPYKGNRKMLRVRFGDSLNRKFTY